MAKIDTTSIAGFDKMTDAEKVAALTGMELPEPDYTGYVSKQTFDNAASELAKLKKEQRAALSEAEQKEAETKDRIQQLEEQLAEVTAREQSAAYKAKLIGLGYDEKLAGDTAAALLKGDMDKVFANQAAFLTAHDKAYKSELMGGITPPPAGSVGGNKLTLEAFKKMDMADRAKFSQEHPDEYKSLYEGGTT